jgi:short-subunit dehydrogenase
MQKAIIIGATSGIGKGLATLLAENGYVVGITGRRSELLDELKRGNPDSFVTTANSATAEEKALSIIQDLFPS